MIPAKPDANGIRPFTHSLTIHAIPPSANKYQRAHWAVKGKLRKQFAALLREFIDFEEDDAPKMRVQITVYSKGARARRLDPDNLWGGCKPLIDAMRDVRLIRNDSPKWLDLGVCENREDGPFTIIEFEEAK